MRRIAAVIAFLVLLSPLYADTRISYIAGSVSVFHDNAWIPADTSTVLGEKDRVRTAAQSRAVLLIDGRTHVWVGQNSEMEVGSLGNDSFFSLLAGKIRAKVKLLSGQKFHVKTPVAIASVRGTEFVLSFGSQLIVLEGKVDFSDLNFANLIEVAKGQIGEFGSGGTPSVPRELTNEENTQLLQEWQAFESQQQGGDGNGGQQQEGRRQGDQLRQEMHQIAGQMRTELAMTRELTNEIKESDISAGRTLRDVHGNLVRVEQHLLRPDNQTLEILNLTKRSEYTYSDRWNWGFTVPSTSRLDVLDINIKMNMPLPEQITEWPSYISSKGDNMHPEQVRVRITNQDDVMTFVGNWTPKGQPDPTDDNKILNDDRLVFDSYINGWKVNPNYKPEEDPGALYPKGTNADGHDRDELWAWGISPQMELTKDGATKYIRLYSEGYGIDNGGAILSLNKFTSSSENPFTLFKQVAGEQITFARNLDGSSFFRRGNLDLVVTPDLAVAVAEKLATQLGDISKSSDNK